MFGRKSPPCSAVLRSAARPCARRYPVPFAASAAHPSSRNARRDFSTSEPLGSVGEASAGSEAAGAAGLEKAFSLDQHGAATRCDDAPLPVERRARFSVIELKPVTLEVDSPADEVDRRPVPVHDPAGKALDLRVLVDGGGEIGKPGG